MTQLTLDGGKTEARCTCVLKSALKRGENGSTRSFDGCESLHGRKTYGSGKWHWKYKHRMRGDGDITFPAVVKASAAERRTMVQAKARRTKEEQRKARSKELGKRGGLDKVGPTRVRVDMGRTLEEGPV